MDVNAIEEEQATKRCQFALDGWGLDEAERKGVLVCGLTADEPGGAVALETRMRHLIDIDRSVCGLVGKETMLPVWLRLPQDALDGLSPLEALLVHESGLRYVRGLLKREMLERGFAA